MKSNKALKWYEKLSSKECLELEIKYNKKAWWVFEETIQEIYDKEH